MSDQLSLLSQMFQKQNNAKFNPGKPFTRASSAPPAQTGFARGASGSSGANLFRGRNSDAGAQKEVSEMQSPIFKAFLQKLAGHTPITNYLMGK